MYCPVLNKIFHIGLTVVYIHPTRRNNWFDKKMPYTKKLYIILTVSDEPRMFSCFVIVVNESLACPWTVLFCFFSDYGTIKGLITITKGENITDAQEGNTMHQEQGCNVWTRWCVHFLNSKTAVVKNIMQRKTRSYVWWMSFFSRGPLVFQLHRLFRLSYKTRVILLNTLQSTF